MIKKLIGKLLGGSSKKTKTRREDYAGDENRIDSVRVDPSATKVVGTLRNAGFEAYIVGGAVRDLMLGITPKDFDVATNATPEQTKPLFRRAFLIGRRFRIVHVLMGGDTIEVTTFRGPAQTEAQKDEHGRVLSDNTYGSIEDDAIRRDFTVNAMYYDPFGHVVVDFVGGKNDLDKKTLRLIGDPETRYREDPVRMLRAVRLAAKLGFKLAKTTDEPIARLAPLISNVPPARLFDEIQKLLLSGHAVETLKQLRAHGLHKGLLPLLDVSMEDPMGQKFVQAALASTDARVSAGKGVSPAFLFAALLWSEVAKAWKQRLAAGEYRIPALIDAANEVIDTQCENLSIPRRYTAVIGEIWSMQPRFEQRTNSAAERFVGQERFRAAYDFLLLRAQCGDVEQEIADWWTAFQKAEPGQRNAMITSAREAAQKQGAPSAAKKRRRRGGRRASGSGEKSSAADAA
jgi:poly(A) polymerase